MVNITGEELYAGYFIIECETSWSMHPEENCGLHCTSGPSPVKGKPYRVADR